MNPDFLSPQKAIGDKVKCLTLTKAFFDENKIDANKKNLQNNFNSFKDMPIQYMDQVHGNVSRRILSYSPSSVRNTDAIITAKSNIVLAALSADCLPITVSKRDGSEFAIIHAGWKGLVSGVIESSLSSFTNKNKDLCAWIGPSISRENYEVSDDLYKSFISKDRDSEINFTEKMPNKWLFNLRDEAKRILEKFKVQVQSSDVCTLESHLLYSFRKDQTENRIVTIIWRN